MATFHCILKLVAKNNCSMRQFTNPYIYVVNKNCWKVGTPRYIFEPLKESQMHVIFYKRSSYNSSFFYVADNHQMSFKCPLISNYVCLIYRIVRIIVFKVSHEVPIPKTPTNSENLLPVYFFTNNWYLPFCFVHTHFLSLCCVCGGLQILAAITKTFLRKIKHPVDAGRKLNVHKTFRRRLGRLLNLLCTFNLRLVSTGQYNRK